MFDEDGMDGDEALAVALLQRTGGRTSMDGDGRPSAAGLVANGTTDVTQKDAATGPGKKSTKLTGPQESGRRKRS